MQNKTNQGQKVESLVLNRVANMSRFCLTQGQGLIACEQALRGALAAGQEKEKSLQLRLWNLNICIEKVDAKCWLAEMTLVMTSLPLAHVVSMFVYICTRFRFGPIGWNLTAQSTGSHRGIGNRIQIPET